MTHPIDEFAAGPVLDRLVAQRVMGWTVADDPPRIMSAPGVGCPPESWRPSSIPDHALQALRHLQSEDWHVQADIQGSRGAPDDEPLWQVELADQAGASGSGMDYSLPLALSKAMLLFCQSRGER